MAANNTGLLADINVVRQRGYCDFPPFWNFDYIQSIKSEYTEGEGVYASQRDKLKDEVRVILKEITDPLVQLETINVLERLGIYYHFEDEIKSILDGIFSTNDFDSGIWKENLYAAALKFRLLRQHLYSVPQEIFNVFKDESRMFRERLGNDVKGMLSLYEASFVLMHGENILEEAREFTTKHLQEFVKQNKDQTYLSELVRHALETPLHWRVPRLEARWFINIYRRSHEIMNPTFLEFSILDYNIVQAIHQEELRQLSRWWRDLKITEKMSFFRDRLVENTLWNLGMVFEPQHAYCRIMESKVYNFMAMLDDTYDTYGALHELELLTTAFESWDLKAMDQLPYYMKMTFFVIFNFTNEVAFNVLNEKGLHAIKYLKKMWADLCKVYLQEAKWYFSGAKPTFHEYLENAWISIAVIIVLVTGFFCTENPITKEALEQLDDGYPSIIRQSSLIIRLSNDLVTNTFEKKKGDAPSSIVCYMHETGVSEDEARRHINSLISETWKQLNEDLATNSAFSRTYVELVTNFTRMSMWFYNGRDGYGVDNHCVKDCALSVFVNPISLEHGDEDI